MSDYWVWADMTQKKPSEEPLHKGRFLVHAQQGASAATYHQVTLNGPGFYIMDEGCPGATNKRPAIKIRSAHTRWEGWVPIEEILICGQVTKIGLP